MEIGNPPTAQGGGGKGARHARPGLLILGRSLLSGDQRVPGLSLGWARGVSFIAGGEELEKEIQHCVVW